MKSAIDVIKKFWEIQDEGDYTKVIDLFSEDALFEDVGKDIQKSRDFLENVKKKI